MTGFAIILLTKQISPFQFTKMYNSYLPSILFIAKLLAMGIYSVFALAQP